MISIIINQRRLKSTFVVNPQYQRRIINVGYLTTEQFAKRISYNPRTNRNRLKDSIFVGIVHYFRPSGGRKFVYVWEAIEQDLQKHSARQAPAIRIANGRVASNG